MSKILVKNPTLQGERPLLGGPEYDLKEILANGAGQKENRMNQTNKMKNVELKWNKKYSVFQLPSWMKKTVFKQEKCFADILKRDWVHAQQKHQQWDFHFTSTFSSVRIKVLYSLGFFKH